MLFDSTTVIMSILVLFLRRRFELMYWSGSNDYIVVMDTEDCTNNECSIHQIRIDTLR